MCLKEAPMVKWLRNWLLATLAVLATAVLTNLGLSVLRVLDTPTSGVIGLVIVATAVVGSLVWIVMEEVLHLHPLHDWVAPLTYLVGALLAHLLTGNVANNLVMTVVVAGATGAAGLLLASRVPRLEDTLSSARSTR